MDLFERAVGDGVRQQILRSFEQVSVFLGRGEDYFVALRSSFKIDGGIEGTGRRRVTLGFMFRAGHIALIDRVGITPILGSVAG
jgi:hypothetical protein